MKKIYTAPAMRVNDIQVEEGLLLGLSKTNKADGSDAMVKAEFGSDIDMSEVGGNAVGSGRRNPWDSQW